MERESWKHTFYKMLKNGEEPSIMELCDLSGLHPHTIDGYMSSFKTGRFANYPAIPVVRVFVNHKFHWFPSVGTHRTEVTDACYYKLEVV